MTQALSIAFMSCNRVARVEQSLGSILAQSLDDIDVIICDDASTDGTYEKLQQIVAKYRGAKRLQLKRNPQRLGVVGNFNRIMAEAQSNYVMFAHDDDLSLPERAAQVLAAIKNAAAPPGAIYNDAYSLVGDARAMEIGRAWPDGLAITPEAVAGSGTNIVGAVATYARRVYSEFGPVPAKAHFEDACCLFRAALLGNVVHLAVPLVEKRVDKQSLTGASSALVAPSGRAARQAMAQNIRNLLPTTSIWSEDLEKYAPQLAGGEKRVAAIRRLLAGTKSRVEAELGLLEHRLSAWRYWLAALARRQVGLRAVIKLALVAYWPGLWTSYMRWRYRRLGGAKP